MWIRKQAQAWETEDEFVHHAGARIAMAACDPTVGQTEDSRSHKHLITILRLDGSLHGGDLVLYGSHQLVFCG